MKSLSKFVVFSFAMIIIMTIATLLLTALTEQDYSQIYTVFCGIFGGEILCACLIKIFKLKEKQDE